MLKAVFLVERDAGFENSLVMDAQSNDNNEEAGRRRHSHHGNAQSKTVCIPQGTIMKHDLPTPSSSPDGRIYPTTGCLVREYLEMWDYTGGTRFRGFVAEKGDERAMFVFFDKEVLGKDLKLGLVALLELASGEYFECEQLIICIDRTADKEHVEDTTRNLSWVGFELMMLDLWSGNTGSLSERWIFVGMDI